MAFLRFGSILKFAKYKTLKSGKFSQNDDYKSSLRDGKQRHYNFGIKMPVFQKQKKKILFIHIPKAGGTSIEFWLKHNDWHMSFFDDGEREFSQNTYTKCSPQHFHASIIESIFNLQSFDFIFAVVRHPTQRIVSEFNWRREHFGIKLSRSEWIQNALNEYAKNNFIHDNHIRPQIEFISEKCHTFKLEDGMNSILSEIRQAVGEDMKLPTNVHAMKSSAPPEDLESTTQDMIKEFYFQDFLRFGYE